MAARTVSQIQTQIENELVSSFATVGITIDTNKWSKRNMMRLLCFIFAVCTAYVEQLMDSLKASIEVTASQAAAASNLWIQAQMYAFQYSATDPQILQLIEGVPQYQTIDPSLRIITANSVTSTTPNEVIIKAAKNNPFEALNNLQLAAAQGYINQKGTAGIRYIIRSLESDKIYINANIYYQGQCASVIQSSVIATLHSFLQNLSIISFNGAVKMSDLEKIIREIPGVNDVVLLNVRGREDTALFDAGIDLISNQTIKQRMWNTIAGYVGEENTTGKTFADSLNFIAE